MLELQTKYTHSVTRTYHVQKRVAKMAINTGRSQNMNMNNTNC